MDFQAPWNRTTWLLTTFVIVVLIAVSLTVGGRSLETFVLTFVPAAGIVIVSWALAPARYSVTGTELLIHRPLRPRRIPRADIRGARLLAKDELRGTIRTFGNGGLFGFYGRFYSARLGQHRWYASRNEDLVAVDTVSGLLVLSPDDPKRFVDCLTGRS